MVYVRFSIFYYLHSKNLLMRYFNLNIILVFCDNINSHVVGGSNSNIANHRHQVSLRVNNSHSCGASLVSGTRAVCAAHCGGGAL